MWATLFTGHDLAPHCQGWRGDSRAFPERDVATEDLSKLSAIHVTLPWAATYAAEARAILDAKFGPYGIEANRADIETMARYAHEQGLVRRLYSADEMFPDDVGT